MEPLIKKFEKMGARAKLTEISAVERTRSGRTVNHRARLDIGRDKIGPFYNIAATSEAELIVLDVQAKDRHLLLMSRVPDEKGIFHKDKFLCGHDERDWFIAVVPQNRPVSNVITAKEALKPQLVLNAQEAIHLPTRKRNRRHNEAFLRQGEWFFVPTPKIAPAKWLIIQNEPLSRGAGKPHTAEYLYRTGGTTVYVSRYFPDGISEGNYQRLMQTKGGYKGPTFSARRLNPEVYVKGRITHSDHKTLLLNSWHRVLPNTETAAVNSGRAFSGFID